MERYNEVKEYRKNCTTDWYSCMHTEAYSSAEGDESSFLILRSVTLKAHPTPRSFALIVSACNDLNTF